MSRILRVHTDGKYYDFDYNKISSYHFEEQCDGRIAFLVKEMDVPERHLFYNNETLKIQLVEE